MRTCRSILLACLLLPLLAWAAPAASIEVHNPGGAVSVTFSGEARFQIQGEGATRPARQEDIQITRLGPRTVVRSAPADGERIDLKIEVPLGFLLAVTTESGAIEVNGMVRQAVLRTKTGDIRLGAPWQATRLQLDADTEPATVITPEGAKFSRNKINVAESRSIWRMRDRLPDRHVTYGEFRVTTESPGEIRLTEIPIPPESPIKMHWQAPEVLEAILTPRTKTPPPPPPQVPAEDALLATEEEGAVFRSDVRMVNLVVAVNHEGDEPATNLAEGDFSVVENGVPQEVTFAGSDNVPFNLAILLDLSGSTQPDRAAMMAAAKRFVSLAGPRDRVAVYALAGDTFHVISNLTDDFDALRRTIERLPPVSGASPVYDAIVLGYAEDLLEHPGERNALIVISDGIDNQVSHQENPSKVRFQRLAKASGEMHALIYPVFLVSGERFGRNWSKRGRERMQQLADASGGRLFPAESIDDLEPVFPQIEAELRSVYSVAYYPKNQNFDGAWRQVEVKIKRPGLKVRARPGYYAR